MPALDVVGVGPHELDDLGEGLVVQVVDLVVARGDLAGLDLVDVDQRPQDPVDQLRRELAHRGQVDVVLERRLRRELAGLLRDRRRVVADPLQLVGDVVEREQEPQVARDRALRRDGPRDQRGRVALGLVDPAVAGDDREGGVGVVRDERRDRRADLVLDEHPHAQHVVLDLALLAVERLARRMRLRAIGRGAVRAAP